MDHKSLVAGLSEDQRLALTARSDWPGLVHLAGHLGAIALCSAGILWPVPFWPVLVPVQGVLIVFLFTLLHETVHETPFASAWLNRWVGRGIGVLLILPPEWFRFFHLAHHRHTNDPEQDPELEAERPATWRGYIAYLSGVPTWVGQVKVLLRNALGRCADPFVPARARPRIRAEARWMLGIYALTLAAAAVWPEILWLWAIPALAGQPALRLYLLAEHGRCPPVANMLENTRTTLTLWIVRKLSWNMPYHAEHHAYPNVPFHKLPAFHAIAKPHLRVTERGYLRFHARVIAALRGGEDRPLGP